MFYIHVHQFKEIDDKNGSSIQSGGKKELIAVFSR